MHIILNHSSMVPIYEQLMEQIKSDIIQLTLGMMGVIAAIAYLCEVVFGKERLYQTLTVIDNMNVAVLAGNIIGITLLTLFISYQISRRIMEKKEF